MKLKLAIVFLLASSVSARAQQPDPAFLQRAAAALQQQRNAALDQAAGQQARAEGLAEDVAKLKARIADLEQAAAKPDAKSP